MSAEPEPYDLDTPWSKGWSPDHGLVPAVLAASRPIATIASKQDRCWLVAGLKATGLTADDIADRLKCSLRLVRTLLAEDMAKVCEVYFDQADTFTEELRLARHELAVRGRELAEAAAEATRVREQRDRLIDMAVTGEPIKVCRRGQHVMDRYNTYEHPATGKKSCRKCRYDALRRHRGQDEVTGVTSAPPAAHGAPGGLAGTPASVATAHAGGLGDHGPAAGASVVAASAVHGPGASGRQ